MKNFILIFAAVILSQVAFGQEATTMRFEYEIGFDKEKMEGKDVKQTVRALREHIFTQRGEKFDMHIKYDSNGRICAYSAVMIPQKDFESFFEQLNADLVSFKHQENLVGPSNPMIRI
ncbi:MAG: hypothetical protein R3277_06615 [Brumimicrobium sp.]|nr:hypothetical protein [Brumimicrobium sp.]